MPLVHHYHPETGVYLGSSEANESPLEPGKFLLPADATTMVPPEAVPEGQVRVFSVEDQRWGLATIEQPAEDDEEVMALASVIVDEDAPDPAEPGTFLYRKSAKTLSLFTGDEWVEVALK